MMRRSYCASHQQRSEEEEERTYGKVEILSPSFSSDFNQLKFHIEIDRLGLQEVTMNPREDLSQRFDERPHFDRSNRRGRQQRLEEEVVVG
jgi:hypothetical protein